MANAAARNATGDAKDPKAAAKDAKAKAKAAKRAKRQEGKQRPERHGPDPPDHSGYQVTHEYDRALPYLLIGAFVLPIAIGVVIGLLWGYAFNVILRRHDRAIGRDVHAPAGKGGHLQALRGQGRLG